MYLMAVDGPGWTKSGALDLRHDLLTVQPTLWELKTAPTVKMLECGVLGLSLLALKELSDFKMALPRKDVWKSATTMPGAQCVMTDGIILTLKLHADSWDCHLVVSYGGTSIL